MFCTLFNTAYLSRGLAMYRSLIAHMPTACLYVVCFDNETFEILSQLNYSHLIPIALGDFEDEALLSIKGGRSFGEYCWTCTPSVIRYVIQRYNLGDCTYVDADLYFFNSPAPLLELGDKSVSITPHRYTPKYDQSKTSGIYCVQFMTFKNNPDAMAVLEWWRNKCIEWCFNRFEEGKFGDQKYLDDWPERFHGTIQILESPAAGVAPWNVQQYKLVGSGYMAEELTTGRHFQIIFYHFHSLKVLHSHRYDLGVYELSKSILCQLYRPYIKALNEVGFELSARCIQANYHGIVKNKGLRALLVDFKRLLKGQRNIYRG